MDPKGRFHVYVEYENEMFALGAIRVAERIIRALDSRKIHAIDVEQEVEDLRRLARIGARLRYGERAPDPGAADTMKILA